MSLKAGDRLVYTYPNPLNSKNKSFSGRVEVICETYVILKNDQNILLKISWKNFDYLTPLITPIKGDNVYE